MNRVQQFYGYRRPDGTIGIRNYVLIISAMDNVNPVARRIAACVQGSVAIAAGYGRGMVGEDQAQHDRTLSGFGTNPNAAAAVVVSLEPESARAIAEPIANTGRPVQWFAVEEMGGTLKTTAEGIRSAMRMVIDAGKQTRQPAPLSELVLGVECGGSDTTSGVASNPATGKVADWLVDAGGTVILSERNEIIGGEDFLIDNAASESVREALRNVVQAREARARQLGFELTNLAPDNIAGGLTTMEEKSIGAILKGGTSPVQEVLGYACKPTNRGLVFMDAPAPGTENITSLGAAGAHAIIFSTGVGNTIGCPIAPTIKVSGNPNTVIALADNIDVDVSSILKGEKTIEGAAEDLYTALVEVANGQLTQSEVLGDVETVISRWNDYSIQ
jgi:altronate dehydratase large subunit